MKFVEFLVTRTEKWNNETMRMEKVPAYISETVGSDSILYLDGRYNLETCILKATERLEYLQKHYPGRNYSDFTINQGESIIRNYREIYTTIK